MYVRDGVIPHSALMHIWKSPAYPTELHGFLLSLLERFEIIFPIRDHAYKLGTTTTQLIQVCID